MDFHALSWILIYFHGFSRFFTYFVNEDHRSAFRSCGDVRLGALQEAVDGAREAGSDDLRGLRG